MQRIVWASIGLLMAVAVAGCERAQSQTQPPPPKPPIVYYTQPQSQQITDFEDFTGHTEAVKTVQIRARVSGYLVKVNFEDGAEVKEGDVLFEIDSRPYVADLENKEALVAQNERHLQRLNSDYDRAQKMLASKAISQEQFDQYRYDDIEEQATLRAAKASRDLAQLNVDFTQVRAPISGKASRRLVDAGNLVIADTTALTTIVSEDPIYGYFDIDEHTLLRIRRLVEEGKIKSEADSPVRLRALGRNGLSAPRDDQFHRQSTRCPDRHPAVPRNLSEQRSFADARTVHPRPASDRPAARGAGDSRGGSGDRSREQIRFCHQCQERGDLYARRSRAHRIRANSA